MSNEFMKVSTGFKLVYYGLVMIVLAVVIAFVGACVLGGAVRGGAGAGAGAGDLLTVLLLGVGLLAIAGSITGLVGRIMCLAVPPETGNAKTMIVISVILELTGLGATVLNLIDDLVGGIIPIEAKMIGSAAGSLFSIIAAILFLLFASKLAKYMRRRELAERAMRVLWLWVGTVVAYIVGLIVMVVGLVVAGPGGAGGGAAVGGACVGLLIMLSALVLALVSLVLYARLLIDMSEATRRFAVKGARKADRYEDEDEYDDDDEEDDDDDYDDRRRRRRDDDNDDDDDDQRGRRRSRDDDDDDDDRDNRGRPWDRGRR